MPWHRTLSLAFVFAGATAGSAGAQAMLRGRVRADSSRSAIPFAVVEIRDLARSVQASMHGVYTILDLAPGAHTLVARAVGYQPLSVPFEIAAGDTLDVDLLLLKSAVELAPLEVVGKSERPVVGKMTGFAERWKAGFGRFYDRTALNKLGDGAILATQLRQTAGIVLIQVPYPCSGHAAASGRGIGTTAMPARMVCSLSGVPLAPACYLSIYLDGVQIWAWGEPDPPNVDDIGLFELEGVEIYRGASELPTAFQRTGSACGAVLLWTRTGETP